jgi:hypothetical protein
VPRQTLVAADLAVTLEVPDRDPVTATLTGSGTRLELAVSDPAVFAGRGDAAVIRGLASTLASAGLSVRVSGPTGPLVTLGAPRTPWWQRRVTGSRHIRVERGAGLWSLARGRVRATAGALPTAALLPPPAVWPPAPTLWGRSRRITTTHDPSRGGDPRLVMVPSVHVRPGPAQDAYSLRRGVTTIGSAEECDVRLAGLAPRHAEIHHDERDEYVLVRLGRVGDTLVNGRPVDSEVLRTASRVQLGGWTMTFYREEYADHGRPHGGRQGGEIGRQRPQPSRPEIVPDPRGGQR